MRDFQLCDLQLLPADERTTWSLSHLELQTRRILDDLGRLLPLLHCLEYSELACRHVCSREGLMLRLVLQPRQRNLLASPKRGNTFEIEAARLQSEMFNLGPVLRRLARAAKGIPPHAGIRETDLTLELLVRRSGKRWRLMQEGGQTELVFPDSPSVLIDHDVHRIEGFVHTIAAGGPKFVQKVTLSDADVHPSDGESTRLPGLDEIVVYVPTGAECSTRSTSRVDRPVWGNRWACLGRLHRCALSGSIMGATLTGVLDCGSSKSSLDLSSRSTSGVSLASQGKV
jgi:hypothetical protein